MTPADLEHNPFFVLGVPISATRLEVERAGQKLLGLLAIGAESAKRYETPFGTFERDESKVRSALSTLRDPEQRVLHELWCEGPNREAEPSLVHRASHAPPAWRNALRSIGWGARVPGNSE